ncbi:MAG: hypothetical protein OQL19_14160 [Gammaproteobacteria bacterium]|nr:hypothetical protein [Gammaproteobacteria bacterium]
MQRKKINQLFVPFKSLLISSIFWTFVISGHVYADKHLDIYPSDMIDEKRNHNDKRERGVRQYQDRNSFNFYDKGSSYPSQYPIQYKYLPPMQKPGSNPFYR